MSQRFRNSKDNMTVRDVKHSFSESVGTLHIVKISAGRAETGLTGKRNPAHLIAAVTAIHGAILRVFAVEDFSDFGNDDRSKL